MRDIRDIARDALQPDRLARLMEVLDDNHGYQAVSRLNMDLSRNYASTFWFEAGRSVSAPRSPQRVSKAGPPRSSRPSNARWARPSPCPASRRPGSTAST